jgi:lycopene beta-cyclase
MEKALTHIDLRYDVILAGGGLANGLLAYCLKRTRPELRLLMIESANVLGGNHTWSFHLSDIKQAPWLTPLISKYWPGYEVHFPAYERHLEGGYASIISSSFHAALSADLGDSVLLGHKVALLSPNSVMLENGVELAATCVIDGRGNKNLRPQTMGFQKFLGLEVETAEPHGVRSPILMDVRVPQKDGFRFFYILPFSANRLLVEDTRYSNGPLFDEAGLRFEVQAYCRQRNWRIQNVEREEKGVLPIPYFSHGAQQSNGVPAIGLSGGFFHPVTGYSLPLVVQLANGIAALPELSSHTVAAWLENFRAGHRRQFEFLAFLNRMLFQAADPDQRYRVLQHFYRHPPDLIERFYGARLEPADYLRILSGRPPVPVLRALKALVQRKQSAK